MNLNVTRVTVGVRGEVATSRPFEYGDYRHQLVDDIHLEYYLSEVGKSTLEWVAARQQLHGVLKAIRGLEDELKECGKGVRTEKKDELKEIKGGNAAERAGRRLEIVREDSRFRLLEAQLADALEDKYQAQVELDIATERLKTIRGDVSGRQYLISFYRSLARIPIVYAPDPDGVLPSRAEVASAMRDDADLDLASQVGKSPTDLWVGVMSDSDAWDSPAAKLALQGVLPEGVDREDDRVKEILILMRLTAENAAKAVHEEEVVTIFDALGPYEPQL